MSWLTRIQIGELNIRLTEYVPGSRLVSVTWSVLWLHLRCLSVKFMDLPSSPQCSDINTINDGLGDKICVFVQFFCTFIAGFVIVSSMAGSWRWSFLLSVLCWQDQQLFGLKYVWCLIIYFYFLDQMVWWIT